MSQPKNVVKVLGLLVMLTVSWATAATWTVTKTADTDDGTCDTDCSLREAIKATNNNDTITFDAGLGTIKLESDLPIITVDNLTIDASDLGNKVTIDGDNKYRIFNHTGTGTLAINNLMVTKGFTTGDGGGIRSAGSVIITNSEISSNSTGEYGGGIRSAGDVTVINSTISNNTATSEFGAGGGIYTAGASTVSVTDSVIIGNQARWGGGGIYNDNSAFTTNVIITNSVVSGNEVESSGGGIWSVGKIAFSGCTKIEDNKADNGNDQWRSDGASDDNGTLAATSDEPYIGDCPTDGGSVINPDPDIQIRNGNSMAAASIISGTVIDVGTFKRGEAATVDFLIRNPSAQVLELGELVLPDFLANAGEPLPETLASFGSTLLTLEVNTLTAGQLEGAFSLASNDPDEVENPFVFTVKGSVSETPANVLNILPGVELGDISAAAGEDDVVLLSFKLLVPAGSTSVTVDSLTLAANNAGIERAENLELYIDGGTRGELDNRDVFLSSTNDTETLTFNFDARTFQPTVPMWFIVVGDF